MSFFQLLDAHGARVLTLAAVVATIWAGLRFVFEPHVAKVVERFVRVAFEARATTEQHAHHENQELGRRIGLVEVRMSKIEIESNRTTEAVNRIDEAMGRLTLAFEKVSETVQGVAVSVARIEGTMERRHELREH